MMTSYYFFPVLLVLTPTIFVLSVIVSIVFLAIRGKKAQNDALNGPIPAGWYIDPYDPASERFWDGNSWTAQLRPRASGSY